MSNQIFNKLRRAAHRLGSLWHQIRRSGTPDLLLQASDPSTPSEVLEMLCSHQDEDVVMAALSNPQLKAGTVNRLAGHSSALVRQAVAGHRYCRTEALLLLCGDADPIVAQKAVVRLLDSESLAVRLSLAEARPPREYLRQLTNDPNPEVSAAARQTLSQIDAEQHDALLASFSAGMEEVDSDSAVEPLPPVAETPAESVAADTAVTEACEAGIAVVEQPHFQEVEAAEVSVGFKEEENPATADLITAQDLLAQEPACDEAISSVSGAGHVHADSSEEEARQTAADETETDEIRADETDADETLQNFWAVHSEDFYEVLDTVEEPPAYVADIDPLEDRAHRIAHQLVEAYDWDDGFDILRAVLVRENLGQIRLAIEKEIQLGMTPEELRLAMELRDYWREFGMDGRDSLLGWRDTLVLIRAFSGYPTLTELIIFLDMMHERYERYPKRLYRTFSRFLWAMLRPASGSSPGEFDVLYLELTA